MSHFLLDLQEAHQRKPVGLATNDSLHISQGFSTRSVKFNMPALGSLAATIHPTNYGKEGGDESMDDDHFVSGSSEDSPVQLDGGEVTGGESELAVTEVLRPGGIELAAGL